MSNILAFKPKPVTREDMANKIADAINRALAAGELVTISNSLGTVTKRGSFIVTGHGMGPEKAVRVDSAGVFVFSASIHPQPPHHIMRWKNRGSWEQAFLNTFPKNHG